MEKIADQTEFIREHDVLGERSLSCKGEISNVDAHFQELEKRVYSALQRYSNVHRGAGHNSMVTTELFEEARNTVLEYFGLEKRNHIVVFGNTARLKSLKCMLKDTNSIYQIFSNDLSLPIGVGALVVRRTALPKGIPSPRGGGGVKLVSRNFVIWEDVPARIEVGTPNIIGVITLAVALKLIRASGNENIFQIKTASDSANTILYKDHLSGYSGKGLLSKLRESTFGRKALVPTLKGWVPNVNLDNAASSTTFEAIWDSVRLTWRQSDQVREDIVEEVKKICARFFHAPEEQYEVIFTQNTTEGINIVAEDLKNGIKNDKNIQPVVINTLLEHNSNELPWRYIPGVYLLRFPVDKEGFLDLAQLKRLFCEYNHKGHHGRKRIKMVVISGCSNVTGTMNVIEKISTIAHKYGALILVDAAQLAAHRGIDVLKANIDYLAFSGHKMYAPYGAGGLIVRKGLLKLDDSVLDEIKLSGKENIAGIAALGKAMELLSRVSMDVITEEERRLTKLALGGLRSIPGIKIFGVLDENSKMFYRRGPIISFSMRKIHHNLVAKMLAERGGISVRNGCLCAHLFVKSLMRISLVQSFLSNVSMLLFPRLTLKSLPGIVRVSFGITNTEDEVDLLIHTLQEIACEPIPIINQMFARLYYGTPFSPATVIEDSIIKFKDSVVKSVYYND